MAQDGRAYLLCQPVPTIPVVGCRTVAQLVESLGAVEVMLALDEMAYLAG